VTYTYAQLEALWTQHGGPAAEAPTAAAIALAESGGNPDAILNTAYPGRPNYRPPSSGASPEFSVGLWQVNLLAHPNYTEAQMLTPARAAAAAVAISSSGSNFQPWSTYTSGAYLTHLQGGTPSAAGPTTSIAPGDKRMTADSGWSAFTKVLSVTAPRALANAGRARKGLRHLRGYA